MTLILEQYEEVIGKTLGKTRTLTESDLSGIIKDKKRLYSYIESIATKLPSESAELFEQAALEFTQMINEAEIINNGQTLAAVVAYYPALAELYQKPVLAKLAIPFKTDNNKVEVNIKKRVAKILNGDIVVDTFEVPKPVDIYSKLYKELTFSVNTTDNIFTKAGLSGKGYKVILTKTMLTKVDWKDGDGNTHTEYVTAYVKADKTIYAKVETTDVKGYIEITIRIDDRTGDITVSAVAKSLESSTITPETVTIKTIISSTNDNGYKVVFDEEIESIQRYVEATIPFEAVTDVWKKVEFKGQYNIDYLRDLADAIKAQIQLMKDAEIISELKINEGGFSANFTVDFTNMPPQLNPSNPADFYAYLIPFLLKAINMVYNNTLMEPKYIAVNPEDAHIIESLTNYVTLFGNPNSKVGVSAGQVMAIQKFEVIKSNFVPKGTLYLLTQGNRNNPGIIDAILGAPIVRTVELSGGTTKIEVYPQSTILTIDPKKMAKITLVGV